MKPATSAPPKQRSLRSVTPGTVERERRKRHPRAGLCCGPVRARAGMFDFNRTLSGDEPVLYQVFAPLFAAPCRPLPARAYFDELAGFSDPEIVRRCLGDDYPAAEAVIAQRIARYRAAVADGSTVTEPVREAVRYAAA